MPVNGLSPHVRSRSDYRNAQNLKRQDGLGNGPEVDSMIPRLWYNTNSQRRVSGITRFKTQGKFKMQSG